MFSWHLLLQKGLLLLSFGYSCFAGPTPLSPPASFEGWKDLLPDLVEKVSPGVVNISSIQIHQYRVLGLDSALRLRERLQKRQSASLGSGLLIPSTVFSSDKKNLPLVLTNAHVVSKADKVMITLLDHREFEATLVGLDEKTDLALLQIQPTSLLSFVTLGDSSQIRVGESVFAIGNPAGLAHTVTHGIISGKNRSIGLGPFDHFLQTDAAINPGNSGGGLFNMRGELIGINTAIHSPTGQSSGLGFAIPIDSAKRLIPQLLKYGRIMRPWLGISALPLSRAIAERYQLPVQEGILVMETLPGEPAAKAGVQFGDILVEINGKKVQDVSDIEKILDALEHHEKKDEWEKVTLRVYRKGKSMTLQAKVHERLPSSLHPSLPFNALEDF